MRIDPTRLPPLAALVRRARLCTIVLVSLAGGAIGGLLLSLVARPTRGDWMSQAAPATLVSTTLLSAAVLALALRPRAGLASAIGWSLLGGFLDVPASAWICHAIVVARGEMDVLEAFGSWLEACAYAIPGAIVSLPLGFAFGLAYAPIVIAVRHQLERPALDVVEQVLLRVTLFVVLVGALAFFLAPSLAAKVVVALFVSAVVPLSVVSDWRIHARRRWVERVASGSEPLLSTVRAVDAEVRAETPHVSLEGSTGRAVVRREDLPTYRTRPRALVLG